MSRQQHNWSIAYRLSQGCPSGDLSRYEHKRDMTRQQTEVATCINKEFRDNKLRSWHQRPQGKSLSDHQWCRDKKLRSRHKKMQVTSDKSLKLKLKLVNVRSRQEINVATTAVRKLEPSQGYWDKSWRGWGRDIIMRSREQRHALKVKSESLKQKHCRDKMLRSRHQDQQVRDQVNSSKN